MVDPKLIFPVGTKFKSRGKHPKTWTVTDVLKTYNGKDELVKVRYVATHHFMGQIVTNHDVPHTTVHMGLLIVNPAVLQEKSL